MDRPRPERATFVFSEPGAPPEPQRTTVPIGIARDEFSALLLAAAHDGLLGQEALEPRFSEVQPHQAIPALVTGQLTVAVIDLATHLGERALGWDGVAIAAFGPLADRSVGVAVVDRTTWTSRRDHCERMVRACTRAHDRLSGDPDTSVTGWWAHCRPSPDEVDAAARWADDGPTPDLPRALAWVGTQD